MLTPETRLCNWDKFRERVHELCSDVEDALNFAYAPRRQKEDEDTPYVRKLFRDLEALDEFLCSHSDVLTSRWADWVHQLLDEEALDAAPSDSFYPQCFECL